MITRSNKVTIPKQFGDVMVSFSYTSENDQPPINVNGIITIPSAEKDAPIVPSLGPNSIVNMTINADGSFHVLPIDALGDAIDKILPVISDIISYQKQLFIDFLNPKE